MKEPNLSTLAEVRQFLTNTQELEFAIEKQAEAYQFVQQTLLHFRYYKLTKPDKGCIREYLIKVTKYSRAQITLLISQYHRTGKVVRKKFVRHHFEKKYGDDDIRLLAKTDELHDFPNGCALKAVLQRMANFFGKAEYKRISQISVAQIYVIRQTTLYQRITKRYEPTKASKNQIGVRRKPQPNNQPGYIRVDTVHQGDQDGKKGVYHINMVDEVVQFELIGAVEAISEAHLTPLLDMLLDLFPYIIVEFHSDNGSEYINRIVVRLLNKLLIEQSKSRSRKTTDNALVEGKNGSVIRKWMGYAFIPKGAAKLLNDFYFGFFHEYVNYHRVCGFAKIKTDEKGKQKKYYPQSEYQTPYQKLISLPNVEQYLKPGVTLEQLEAKAKRYTDNEMAELVQKERSKLFKLINQSL